MTANEISIQDKRFQTYIVNKQLEKIVNYFCAPLRIIAETLWYRARRREGNNFLTTLSLMAALKLTWPDFLYRGGFALLLNIYVYLINDYCDVEIDIASADKDRGKTVFLKENRKAAKTALFFMAFVLVVGGILHSPLLFICFLANTFIVYSYSAWFKRMPYLDVIAMVICGITMSLAAIPQNSAIAYRYLVVLGLICSAFEVVQIIRDEPEDRLAGIRTTAVRLGLFRARLIFVFLAILAAVYAYFIIHSLAGLLFLAAAAVPLSSKNASRAWDILRLIFGTAWLLMMAELWARG